MSTSTQLLQNKTLFDIVKAIIIGDYQVETLHNLLIKNNQYPDEVFYLSESDNSEALSLLINNIAMVRKDELSKYDYEHSTFNIVVLSFIPNEEGKIEVKCLGLFEWLIHLTMTNTNTDLNRILTGNDWSLNFVNSDILELHQQNMEQLLSDRNFQEITNSDFS